MKHPTDPAQLSRWLRTPRTGQSPADYANPVEHAEEVRRTGEFAERVMYLFAPFLIGVMLGAHVAARML